MKNMYRKITAVILSTIVLTFSILFITQNKKEFSENENRYLEQNPKFSWKSLVKGEYIAKLEDYLADQFPFRDDFMSIKTKTDKLLGKKDMNHVFLGKEDYLLEMYQKPKNNDKIIKTLNDFYSKINYINLNLLLAPTSITINQELLPKYAPTYNQEETIDYIYNKIKFNSIQVVDTLKQNNQKYQMYYRLDHHWTTYGAYYAYVEYCKQNNIEPLSINDFEIEEVTKDFNGTLYSKSNDYKRKSDSIYLFQKKDQELEVNYVSSNKIKDTMYEMSYLDKKDKYSIFLDNNHPLIVITNQKIKTEKEIIVIKDSYANSFVPFLTNHFKKVHVIDPRFYKKSITNYIEENQNIKDALILYNVNTMDNDLGILTIN